jgi:hypothetical protein
MIPNSIRHGTHAMVSRRQHIWRGEKSEATLSHLNPGTDRARNREQKRLASPFRAFGHASMDASLIAIASKQGSLINGATPSLGPIRSSQHIQQRDRGVYALASGNRICWHGETLIELPQGYVAKPMHFRPSDCDDRDSKVRLD